MPPNHESEYLTEDEAFIIEALESIKTEGTVPWEEVKKECGLTKLCETASISALAGIWDTPEEDEAWAHLQSY